LPHLTNRKKRGIIEMKKFMRTMAMVIAMVLTIGSTALADTYSYEDYERAEGGFFVDHYHGDTVSVLLYEFAQDDISIAGITCYYKFYCVGGNTFILSEDLTEYEGDMVFKYQSIDAEPIDYIDRNPINVWEFSIKPGTYDFSYVNSHGSDGQWNTLNSDFTVFPQSGQEYGDEITVEAGDTVRVYIWHQGYIDGDQTNGAGEKDQAFRAEYLPKFQEWARENEKNVQERMQQSAGPEETVQAGGSTDSNESSAVGSREGQGQEIAESQATGSSEQAVQGQAEGNRQEAVGSTTVTTTITEEKKSNKGLVIGCGIGLLVLVIIGILLAKKK